MELKQRQGVYDGKQTAAHSRQEWYADTATDSKIAITATESRTLE